MSNELIIPGLELVPTPKVSDEQFGALAKSGDWLSSLTLFDSNSKVCKQGKQQPGNFAIRKSKDDFEVLGPQFECIILTYRLTATRFGDDKVMSYHDSSNPEFMKIVETADEEGFGCGCVYGPEFLLWIPKAGQFVQYHMNTKTGRRASGALKALMGNPPKPAPGLLKVKFIETKSFSWWGPEALPYSAPIEPLPDGAKTMLEMKKFVEAPDSEVEAADGDNSEGRER